MPHHTRYPYRVVHHRLPRAVALFPQPKLLRSLAAVTNGRHAEHDGDLNAGVMRVTCDVMRVTCDVMRVTCDPFTSHSTTPTLSTALFSPETFST